LEEFDLNDSGMQHWAAYNDDIFLLQFFRGMGLPLTIVDKMGYSVLGRAICNYSYNACKYLLYQAPETN
jgi:hypothetical protein